MSKVLTKPEGTSSGGSNYAKEGMIPLEKALSDIIHKIDDRNNSVGVGTGGSTAISKVGEHDVREWEVIQEDDSVEGDETIGMDATAN